MTRRRLLIGMGALLLVAGAAALAAPPGPEMRDEWVGRISEARQAVEQARERATTGRSDYSRMRHKRKLRGEKRKALVDERDRAWKDLAAAEKRLEDLLEEARRAGVPPGWVREALDGFDDSPAAPAN